ncbi:hypothetical protein STEG23_000485 [Scotinomys teguina]
MARKAGQGKEEEESRARQQREDTSLPWKRSPCSGTRKNYTLMPRNGLASECESNQAKKTSFLLLCPSANKRGPPRQRQPREDGNEEDKENQGDETQGQQPPQHRYRRNFNYRHRCPENPKPQMAKIQTQGIHQLKIRSLPRLSRAGLSKCWFTISTIIRFGHPTRRNEHEIPAIRNEQRLELKTLSACFLPID